MGKHFQSEADEATEYEPSGTDLYPGGALTSERSQMPMGFCNDLPPDPRGGNLTGGWACINYNGIEWCPSDENPVESIQSSQAMIRDGGIY